MKGYGRFRWLEYLNGLGLACGVWLKPASKTAQFREHVGVEAGRRVFSMHACGEKLIVCGKVFTQVSREFLAPLSLVSGTPIVHSYTSHLAAQDRMQTTAFK